MALPTLLAPLDEDRRRLVAVLDLLADTPEPEARADLAGELSHAQVLATQVAFLKGTPTTTVRATKSATDSRAALQADLQLEEEQLGRYRERFAQANDLGLVDVGEALRPLLEQTQEHVRDLQAVLGD